MASRRYESLEFLIVDAEKRMSEFDFDFDSGCSFHIYLWRYSFTQYRKVDGDMVFMGNIRIGYIGTINYLGLINGIKMEFEEIGHINDLKWIFVILGALDVVGYTCKIEKRTLEM